MDTRREFLKKAALLSAGTGLLGTLPAAIQKALAIDPRPGSTYLDAEHVVVLMQENRSFDHSFGTLRGVRGFNDPRAISLPNGNPVWLQTNAQGETYAPFRLNLRDTKATWMSSLPHSWENQVDARNDGRYDQWLQAKPSGHEEYAHMPLTLGYYDREDIPFYYALADAFTVCDQNFCSSLTGTTPNRLYLWTGTIREEPSFESKANVRNEDVDYPREARWTTFPERLEDLGISWKIYQNELNLPVGFTGEEDAWLGNFSDNPIEWFAQFNVRFSEAHQRHLAQRVQALPGEIAALKTELDALPQDDERRQKLQKTLDGKQQALANAKRDRKAWSRRKFNQLPQRAKNLHQNAFVTNRNDPDYHRLVNLRYRDGDTERDVAVPKGDVLHQFRDDVRTGALPTVSWLVGPENFSDHPGAPWYGAWYVAEVLDILTQNPDVWKKTIFIVCYDENDGYFDHVPPFVAPHPDRPESGRVTKGIDTRVEQVNRAHEVQRKRDDPEKDARDGTIGLGYRVPLLIASPWSRGGYVNSQVFDHTSILQFMETFLSAKTGRPVREPNISAWRRTVCGDLTSVFRPYAGEPIALPAFPAKERFIEGIHQAKFKAAPANFKPLTPEEIAQAKQAPGAAPWLPQQEKGVRPSCALPYELHADGRLTDGGKRFEVRLEAKKDVFGKAAAGSPFHVYAPGRYAGQAVQARSYAVEAGESLADSWAVEQFDRGAYLLRVYGPNGFFREFTGTENDPRLDVRCGYQRQPAQPNALTGNLELRLTNADPNQPYTVELTDNAYQAPPQTHVLEANGQLTLPVDLSRSSGWYDVSLRVVGVDSFARRFAGRVETGRESVSDPLMGRAVEG